MSNTTVWEAPVASASPARRIPTLDVLRGLAIVGTLGTNIWLFTHPWGLVGYLGEPVTPDTPAGLDVLQRVLMALTQGKFLALLTLLFGMGLWLQHASARRRGERWPGRYLWRAALLFVDGLVNYVLIAEFDVLMGYAVTGAIVAGLLLTGERVQRRLVLGFAAAHVLLVAGVTALVLGFGGGGTSMPTGPNPYAEAGFGGLAAFRLDNVVAFRAETVFIGFGSVAMFLLGARLFRSGVLTAEGAGLRRRLLVLGAVAFPVDVALGTWGGVAGVLVERYLVAPFVALGLLAGVAELCLRRGARGWWSRRFAEVGRMALTCYLLQNLVSGALFYGWGLGLAAGLGAARVPVTVGAHLAVSLAMAGFAHLWLRRFERGPVEWLWRRLGELGRRRGGS